MRKYKIKENFDLYEKSELLKYHFEQKSATFRLADKAIRSSGHYYTLAEEGCLFAEKACKKQQGDEMLRRAQEEMNAQGYNDEGEESLRNARDIMRSDF